MKKYEIELTVEEIIMLTKCSINEQLTIAILSGKTDEYFNRFPAINSIVTYNGEQYVVIRIDTIADSITINRNVKKFAKNHNETSWYNTKSEMSDEYCNEVIVIKSDTVKCEDIKVDNRVTEITE